jgi:hypothetical protein
VNIKVIAKTLALRFGVYSSIKQLFHIFQIPRLVAQVLIVLFLESCILSISIEALAI